MEHFSERVLHPKEKDELLLRRWGEGKKNCSQGDEDVDRLTRTKARLLLLKSRLDPPSGHLISISLLTYTAGVVGSISCKYRGVKFRKHQLTQCEITFKIHGPARKVNEISDF